VSKPKASVYRGGPSRNWLKTKNMVESPRPDRDTNGIPWALLGSGDGELKFAGPVILNPPARTGESGAS
jgi:hypothetical protein